MNIFGTKELERNHRKIILALRKAQFVAPNDRFKAGLKDRLCKLVELKQVDVDKLETNPYVKLILWMKQLSVEVDLAFVPRARIKERVFAYAQTYVFSRWSFPKYIQAWGGLALSVVLVFLVAPLFEIPGSAWLDVYVQNDKSGAAYILRDGNYISLEEGKQMRLAKNDIVQSHEDSAVTVNFFDDIITRLLGDTAVLLQRADAQTDQRGALVELELLDGQIWSNVVSLGSGISQFKIVSDDVTVRPVGNASFDLKHEEDGVFLAVTGHVVDISVSGGSSYKEIQKTLVAGYGMHVLTDSTIDSFKFDEQMQYQDKWFVQNMIEDDQLIGEISERKLVEMRKNAGILPDNPLYLIVKSFPEQTKLALTFGSVEHEKAAIDLANQRLVEAQALIIDGKEEEAVSALEEFQKLSEDVIDNVNEMEAQGGSAEVAEIREHIEKTLERSLVGIASTAEFYQIKPVVQEVRVKALSSNENVSSEVLARSAQMNDILSDFGQFLNQENFQQATDLFPMYQHYSSYINQNIAGASEDISIDKTKAAQLVFDRVKDLSYLILISTDSLEEGLLADMLLDMRLTAVLQMNTVLDVLIEQSDFDQVELALLQKVRRLLVYEMTLDVLDELNKSLTELLGS